MECVRARLGDRIYDSTGSPPVLGRKAARQDGELLDSVHTQSGAEHVSGRAVSVVVDGDPVHPVVVECRPTAGNREFRSEAAVATCCGIEAHLRFNLVDARLESGK